MVGKCFLNGRRNIHLYFFLLFWLINENRGCLENWNKKEVKIFCTNDFSNFLFSLSQKNQLFTYQKSSQNTYSPVQRHASFHTILVNAAVAFLRRYLDEMEMVV